MSKASEYVNSREDLKIIADQVPAGARVIDLGCGDGLFLRHLMETKNVTALGIEISQQEVMNCIVNGVPVIHGDLNEKLDYIPDNGFDVVILSCTLQEMLYPRQLLSEMMRIASTGIVGVLNFGFIKTRMQLFFSGRMPVSKTLPHQWHSTPNIHLGTLNDFRNLCGELGVSIKKTVPLSLSRRRASFPRVWPNLLATNCVFVIGRGAGFGAGQPAGKQ